MLQAEFAVVREATHVVLRHVDGLPYSQKREQLHAWTRDCLREAERWSESPPTRRELDVFVKRVLYLHIEVMRLERDAFFVDGAASKH